MAPPRSMSKICKIVQVSCAVFSAVVVPDWKHHIVTQTVGLIHTRNTDCPHVNVPTVEKCFSSCILAFVSIFSRYCLLSKKQVLRTECSGKTGLLKMDRMTVSFRHCSHTHQKALISLYTLQCEFRDFEFIHLRMLSKRKISGLVKPLTWMVGQNKGDSSNVHRHISVI